MPSQADDSHEILILIFSLKKRIKWLMFYFFQPGGGKAGTFDPYPSHSADPYKVKVPRSINVVNKSGKTFMPSMGPKSTPMVSIVNQNVIRYVHTLCQSFVLRGLVLRL